MVNYWAERSKVQAYLNPILICSINHHIHHARVTHQYLKTQRYNPYITSSYLKTSSRSILGTRKVIATEIYLRDWDGLNWSAVGPTLRILKQNTLFKVFMLLVYVCIISYHLIKFILLSRFFFLPTNQPHSDSFQLLYKHRTSFSSWTNITSSRIIHIFSIYEINVYSNVHLVSLYLFVVSLTVCMVWCERSVC